MPRDKRLFMTFPNDFPWHPKVTRLSVEARWAFVEMVGYSRVRDLDGLIPREDAEFEWKPEVLTELVRSHPTRPLVLRDAKGDYVIREYAEHQQTTSDRERLAEVSRENGKKGGRPPKNPKETQPGSPQVPKEPGRKQSLESRVQSSEPTTYVPESSPDADAQPGTDETYEALSRSVLEGLGIDRDRLVKHIFVKTGREVSTLTAKNIASDILARAGEIRTTNQQFVLGSITRSWAEVQKYIDQGTP